MSVIARSLSHYQVEILTGNHTFVSDEPPGVGDDAGPDPFGLLLGALGSCVVITLHMYANRKQWPLESVEVVLDIQSTLASECPDCRSTRPDERVSIIHKKFSFKGDLSPEQIDRLIEISDRCPVNRTLSGPIKIVSSLNEAQP